MEEALRRSESNLLVFVSSMMNVGLKCARNMSREAVKSLGFACPWTFGLTRLTGPPIGQLDQPTIVSVAIDQGQAELGRGRGEERHSLAQ